MEQKSQESTQVYFATLFSRCICTCIRKFLASYVCTCMYTLLGWKNTCNQRANEYPGGTYIYIRMCIHEEDSVAHQRLTVSSGHISTPLIAKHAYMYIQV